MNTQDTIRPDSYVYTTRLVYGEPAVPTGSRVWVRAVTGTKRSGRRALVVVDRPDVEDCSDVQRLYHVDVDALSNERDVDALSNERPSY